ncbi:hypothetical protein C7212DRAFT_313685 [Tuber magnatum]|uniref:Uncharacterized protein n=1 Tax=Tuber magnatum TaxID=42249 RepID=A0A317SV54_9PEZI|nr:hypothetical protein C7212DRAFT_313685 [Tuber magnatum]
MGRERRGRFWRAVKISSKRGKRKVLGSHGVIMYERVMEEGHNQFTDFELGSVSSSSSSDDEAGGTGADAVQSVLGTRIGSRERLSTTTRSGDISPRGGSSARARSPMPPR